MFNVEGLINDKLTVVDVIDPQAITFGATGVLTDAIDMKNYTKLIAVVMSGTLGSSGTFDAKFVGCATSGGTYAAITGKAITQMVKASNDNDVAVIELDRDLVAKSGYRYVKLNLLAGTANSTSAAVVLGAAANYGAASGLNHADVVEVK